MAVDDLIGRMRIGEDAESEVDELLGEDAESIEPDPKPNRTAKASAGKGPAPKVNAATKKEVRDKLTMLIGFPAAVWMQRDPYCASVLNAQSEEIVDRLAVVACRNRRMLAWLTSTGEYTDWIMLATAVWPVVAAVWSHHIARSVEESGYGSAADHPPVAEPFDGAAYGANAWNGYPA